MTLSSLRGSLHGALLDRLRRWLDGIGPRHASVARLLVWLIPARCPFERDVVIAGRKILHIPPLCRINPLFEEVAALRFRALCLLENQPASVQDGLDARS